MKRFRITQPDGEGSSMHFTIGLFSTKVAVIDYLENASDISELMIEDREKKESVPAHEFFN